MTVTARDEERGQRTKVTLRLSPEAHAITQEAVRLGLASNQNAFIEEAIRRRRREIRHERMRRLAEEAMRDPGFVADMRSAMEDFEGTDAEGWPQPIVPSPGSSPERKKSPSRRR